MPIAKNLWTEVKSTGWGRLGEIEYLSQNGVRTPASVNVSMIFTGEVSSIQWIAKDISEEKRAVEKSGFIQQVFERLGEAVLITDTHGRTLYANDIFCKMFRVSKSQIASGDLISLSQVCARMTALTEFWNKLKGKEPLIDSIAVGDSSEQAVTKTLYVLPYCGENDSLKYYVWFFYPAAVKSEKAVEILSR
jgi:PAS domain-containing protein